MATWVTVDDYTDAVGLEPLTDADRRMVHTCCQAASAYITRVRPDLVPPAAWVDPTTRRTYVAVRPEPEENDLGDVCRAAISLAQSWYDQRASGQSSSTYAEFGYSPPKIGKDVQDALRVGRAARSTIA